jgi:hypothetical protein
MIFILLRKIRFKIVCDKFLFYFISNIIIINKHFEKMSGVMNTFKGFMNQI